MEKYYRTDGTNSYIVPDKYDVAIDCFDLKVLQNINIDNLLGFEFRGINQDRMMYYRINGLEQLTTFKSGGIDYIVLRDMLNQLLELIDILKQYMLRPENLVMDAEGIFMDTHSNTYKFIYLPDYEQPVNEQFRHLTEQMLKLVDHKDRRAVDMIYDIYDIAAGAGYHIDAVAAYIKSYNNGMQDVICQEKEKRQAEQRSNINREQNEPVIGNNLQKDYVDKEDLMDMVFSKKETEAADMEKIRIKSRLFNSRTFLLLGIVFTGVTGVVFAAMQLGQNGHIEYVKPLMGIVMLMAILCFIYIHVTRNKAEEPEPGNTYSLAADYSEAGKVQDTCILKMFGDSTSILSQDNRNIKSSGEIIYLTNADGKRIAEITKEDMPYILGRNGDRASKIMTDTGISRRHAKIYERDDRYYIEDMNSTNGTFVNDMEIVSGYPVSLSDGDMIQLGETTYVVQIS